MRAEEADVAVAGHAVGGAGSALIANNAAAR